VATAHATFILCQTGSGPATVDGQEYEIGRLDCLFIGAGGRVALRTTESGVFLKVEILQTYPS